MNSAWRRPSSGCTAVFLMATLVAAPPAHAHLLQTGLVSFADGAARLLLTPSDLMLVCGLAALAVQQGTVCAVSLRLALPMAWLLGGIAGLGLPIELSSPWLNTIAFSLVGLMVALQVPMSRRVNTLLVVLAGSGLAWSTDQSWPFTAVPSCPWWAGTLPSPL